MSVLEIRDAMTVKGLLDEVLANSTKLHSNQISILTINGSYFGELMQRTSEWVVLKSSLNRRVMDGPSKGQEVFQIHYVNLQAIIGLTVETTEPPDRA